MTARGIADDLRNQIDEKQIAIGGELPSTSNLAARYQVSPSTASKAVQMLKADGLVTAVRGGRVRVRQPEIAERHGMDRYSRSRWQSGGKAILIAEAERQGREASQVVLELAEVVAPAKVARQLRITDGTKVWVRRRITRIDGVPNQLADSYYPLWVVDRVPVLQREETGSGGGFARIEEAGIHLAEVEEETEPRMPTADEISSLELAAGTPVTDLVRTIYDTKEQPIEVMLGVLVRASFHYRFAIPE